jgi:serine/threonine-protein kinase HipA
MDQQVLRAIFNIVGRNCNDHVKNIAFLMNRRGVWRLSPAFDISYAWNPRGEWTSRHQMSANGKRDGFEREDMLALAKVADIKNARAEQMIQHVIEVVRHWPDFAREAGVNDEQVKKIQASHRTSLLSA